MGGRDGGGLGKEGREWRGKHIVFLLLQSKMAAQDETKSALAREYLAKIEDELKHTCKEVLVKHNLLPCHGLISHSLAAPPRR